ncbi:MAG: efflux RND transporter permease subunit [Myxococcales bacterium]
MLDKFLDRSASLLRHPWAFVILAVAVMAGFALGIPKLRFDTDVRSMLPEENRDRKIVNYYEDEDRFGSSEAIYVGVKAADVYTVENLKYVKKLQDSIEALNNSLPAENLSELLGLGTDDGKKLVVALRGVGINAGNYKETLVPLLTSAEKAQATFNWDKAKAEKVAAKARHVEPLALYQAFQNPITKTQSILNADYLANEDDSLVVKKLVDDPENLTAETVASLKKRVDSWELYKGAVVSEDGKLSMIVVTVAESNGKVKDKLELAIEKILQTSPDPAFATVLDGEPVIQGTIGRSIFADILLLLPVVVFLVLLILYLSFRNVGAVVYTGAIILFSVVVAMGLMAYCDIPISIVGTTIPVLLVAIVSAYGIHQMNHFLLSPETDKRFILERNLKTVGLAILLSAITVMVGFGALAVEEFVPIKNFGIFVAIGDMVGVFGALFVMPSLILLSRKPKEPYQSDEDHGPVASLLHALVRLNQKHSGAVIAGTVILSVAAGIGSYFMKTEMDTIKFFKTSAPIRQADEFLNEQLAGTTVLNVVLDSDLRDPNARPAESASAPVEIVTPEVLQKMDQFEKDVRAKYPKVGKVLSFNPVIKKMNQELAGNGDAKEYVLPATQELISQYLMIFTGDVKNVLTPAHDKMRMMLYMKRVPTSELEEVREYCAHYFSKEFLEKNHLQVQVTGVAHLYTVVNTLLVDGMIRSVIVCLVIVFVLLLVLLRNVRMSLIAISPIGFALLANFGLLGALDIPLNIATAITSSIAIGIGVDYSIHFITWYRNELKKSPDILAALEHSIVHKGRAILYNMAVIVAGFVVLMLSKFVPLIQFGGLVAFCMVVTAGGALVLVPAIIRVLAKRDRDFLYLGTRQAAGASRAEPPPPAPTMTEPPAMPPPPAPTQRSAEA